MNGYEALREAAAVIDLSSHGRIKATGEDRLRLLHAMTTNHVQDLKPGQGLYAFFLNAQGRVLADTIILCGDDHLLIDLEPEVREKIYQHLDKFIIMDDVTLEDRTDATAEVAVEGPGAAAVLKLFGATLPEAPYSFTFWENRVVVKATSTGQPGFRIILPAEEKSVLLAQLDLPVATPDEARVVRLENGVPRYGEDISESQIAHETGQMHALHFSKGCYLGQEIVERVRSRGLVHKRLYPLRLPGPAIPENGAEIESAGQRVGRTTSAAWSPALNQVVALAYLRIDVVEKGLSLKLSDAPVEVMVSTAQPTQ